MEFPKYIGGFLKSWGRGCEKNCLNLKIVKGVFKDFEGHMGPGDLNSSPINSNLV